VTYTELTDLLIDYLENQEESFVENLPEMIKQGESRIYNTVRTPDQRLSATGTVATQFLITPPEFVEPLGLYFPSGPALQKQTSYIRAAYPASVTGEPKYYAILSQIAPGDGSAAATILLAPTPDGNYEYTLEYTGPPPSITTQSTTWLSINFPEALLYACLLEGYVYMKGEKDMRDTFQERFDRGLEMLRRSYEGLLLKDEYRNRAPGAEVRIYWHSLAATLSPPSSRTRSTACSTSARIRFAWRCTPRRLR